MSVEITPRVYSEGYYIWNLRGRIFSTFPTRNSLAQYQYGARSFY